MLFAILSGFLLALIAPWIYRLVGKPTGWVLALLPAGLFVYFAGFIGRVVTGEAISFRYEWIPALDVQLSFYIDGLSLLFALIISGIGTFIVLYGGGYLKGHLDIDRFFVYLLMFMASMLGLVLSDNLLSLFVFWELTSITSFLLIGYYHEKQESRAAALQALLVTGGGGLAMMAGLVMLAVIGESWELSTLLGRGDLVQAHPLYLPTLLLILIGCFTKSAQFPFHFWLPGAMAAPAPVSAYLHSATMVKAGVYLLARSSPVLGGSEAWLYLVTGVGAVTMLLSAYIAWQQIDLKRILAYSTVSALGILVMLLGLGDSLAVKAAMIFLVVHSLYKGALFMVAGAIDHETGTRFITELGGLRRLMPYTMAAAGLAALSMSGIPLFLGFVAKEYIYEATLETHFYAGLLTGMAVITNILTIVAAGMVSLKPFLGDFVETPKHAHEAPWSMRLGPLTLAGLGLLLGTVLTGWFGHTFAQPAVEAILNKPSAVSLHALPSSFNTVVLLSVITVAGGIGFYGVRAVVGRLVAPLNAIDRLGPEQWYRWALDGLMLVAKVQTRVLQSGYLRYYLIIIILSMVVLSGYTLIVHEAITVRMLRAPVFLTYELLISIIIIAAAIFVTVTDSRLAAVAGLGVVGYGMGVLFILFSAPDLAMTQFSIETLTVILLVLVLYKLPRFSVFTKSRERLRDLGVALAGGSLFTVLVLVVTAIPRESRLTPYFAENSYTLAQGLNVVNVILVDFRGFDTMGEIVVLGVAALGVFALLKLRLDDKRTDQVEPQHRRPDTTDVYPASSPQATPVEEI
ncbi:MAG TPA: putative monovalent cation/H+ antiporter subunit A [Anaerolineae bacterium]|nr:putative monovalent cation/H+ antiporter subunit A [Anaerolineae bacterium]